MEAAIISDELIKKLEKLLHGKVKPVFLRYGYNYENLLNPLKWKPLVLVIGNYSSGKSTFINELLGKNVQRTGQAPTDDSFTILTKSSATDEEGKKIFGNALVNDERLPFTTLKRFGERFFAHLRMKFVDAPVLDNFAIIDTPGMLDSVTEKDRGYAYLTVVGELAKISDLIILMFDPHKAGTIKETYQAIRSILPGSTGEDRVFYVLNRIDECENVDDLLKAYGTLCWNLSQMTGRKDIPRIYLTFADYEKNSPAGFELWHRERDELKQVVATAPKMRLNHIFEEVTRGIRELMLLLEALHTFRKGYHRLRDRAGRIAFPVAAVLFLFGDVLLNLYTGYPASPLLKQIFTGPLATSHFIIPGLGVAVVIAITVFILRNLVFPRYVKSALARVDTLAVCDSQYKKDLWLRVRESVIAKFTENASKQTRTNHLRYMKKLEKILEKDVRKLFEKSQSH